MQITDVRNHLPATPSPELLEYINEVALVKSRYLFTKRIKAKHYSVYCTHCKNESVVDHAIKHNEKTKCPSCSSEVISKQSGRGRGMMVDNAYVEFATKSLLDPNIVTIAGYYVGRDYRESYKDVETLGTLVTIYTFSSTESHMYVKDRKTSDFNEVKRINSLHKGNGLYDLPAHFCYESLEDAIKGTQYQYSQVLEYHRASIPAYLALFCKYPYIEALDKIGLCDIIADRLAGRPTKTINWLGKTLDSIIGLPKRDWKHFRNVEERITQNHLRNFKELRAIDKTTNASELMVFAQAYSVYRLINIIQRTNTNPSKAYRYIHKMMERDPEHFENLADILSTWEDFVLRLERDEVDIQNDKNIYPTNLHEVHQRQIERAREIADAKNSEAMIERYKELEHLSFADEEFLIRPVDSPKELNSEGELLKHCVGGYLNRHLNGSSSIFVVRKVSEPDTPFYTVEIARGAVQQCRGYRNASPTDEVREFMEQFKEARINVIEEEFKKAS